MIQEHFWLDRLKFHSGNLRNNLYSIIACTQHNFDKIPGIQLLSNYRFNCYDFSMLVIILFMRLILEH